MFTTVATAAATTTTITATATLDPQCVQNSVEGLVRAGTERVVFKTDRTYQVWCVQCTVGAFMVHIEFGIWVVHRCTLGVRCVYGI